MQQRTMDWNETWVAAGKDSALVHGAHALPCEGPWVPHFRSILNLQTKVTIKSA